MCASQSLPQPKDPQQEHYYNVPDPAKALATLEDELEKLVQSENGVDKVRHFIEMECAELTREREIIQEKNCGIPNGYSPETFSEPGSFHRKKRFIKNSSLSHLGDPTEWQALEVDPNPLVVDPSMLGEDRITRDGYSARSKLDVEEHLYVGRMGDWTTSTWRDLEQDEGPRWGVSVLPPNMEKMDPSVIEIIRSQQAR
eukprot:TRINITY_DN3670_c0_g1_i1.p1 TRINITY_DN3670_c0_g1~~TRINITY_DN3670_c0_g1_i1.p1  ORF type:complete len:232 (+),score=31.95 TRINITY_DN3670_c0_g1_i1:101-697(+)